MEHIFSTREAKIWSCRPNRRNASAGSGGWPDYSVIFKCYLDPISIVRLLTSALNHLLNRREAVSKNRLMTQEGEFIMAVGQETSDRLNRGQGGFESNPKGSSKKRVAHLTFLGTADLEGLLSVRWVLEAELMTWWSAQAGL